MLEFTLYHILKKKIIENVDTLLFSANTLQHASCLNTDTSLLDSIFDDYLSRGHWLWRIMNYQDFTITVGKKISRPELTVTC